MTATPCLKLPNDRTEDQVRAELNRPKPEPKPDVATALLSIFSVFGGRAP